ncbi:GCN5 family acetyltransferase [Flavobacterium akiainvivens]|uniref:GCN5 family acetyltransferase n=1 Tax=Flavobacterium akiainvivens TaxID=1202724 RepID=A0A0M9VIS1_9FLAO|nr:GNAT family N-acetyltransferase [Flavobacterium akiainvivens]KOS07016.1 GCN5 family acetyltransferase [Flavobacterium akiainvivens]SFQ59157.1 Acetyltransferase (GNAT) domain-containing protein [Flavobacterium akiainvivens]
MDLSGYVLFKLTEETFIKPFDCGDDDLNDFLITKAKSYQRELLAVTYILEDEINTLAYFSIFNDSLKVEEEGFASKNAFKKFLGFVSHPKRHLRHFPAMKLGRLGVSVTLKGKGIGKVIVGYIINMALEQNEKCACKIITVDAYAESLKFYEKIGFIYFTPKDEGKDTRQMYLDLTPIINTAEEHE